MFGPLGLPELIFILVLALLIFGPKRLPEIGRTLGKGMSEFRKASNDLKRTINSELALEETPTPPAAQTAQTARQLPALEPLTSLQEAPETAAEETQPAFRMPQGPPPEVEARSSRPSPPEPRPADAAEPEPLPQEPLEPR